MAAVKGIKGETERNNLAEMIPLRTPFHVMIDASSACNLKCSFCWHGDKKTRELLGSKIMDKELAIKCIDDCKQFPDRLKRISFFCHGEPCMNKHLAEIVEYGVKSGIAEKTGFTTNGILLTPDLSDALVTAGLQRIDISIYGTNDSMYKSFSGVDKCFDRIMENVKYLYSIKQQCSVVVKISDAVCKTDEDRNKFYSLFEGISDKMCIEHAVSFWYDLDIHDVVEEDGKDIYGNPAVHKEVCPVPFYQLVVQSDGCVSACCTDYRHALEMGDATRESLVNIWNGKKYRKLYENLLEKGTQGISPCNHCRFHELVAMDNIDEDRERILRGLNSEIS